MATPQMQDAAAEAIQQKLVRCTSEVLKKSRPGDPWRHSALAALVYAANGNMSRARECISHLADEIRAFITNLLNQFAQPAPQPV